MRTDFDPQATKARMLREGLSWLAHGTLFGLGYIPPRHRPQRRADIRTVVFVHGLAANRACFFPMQAYLRTCGITRQYSFNYRLGRSIEQMAIELSRRLRREIKGGRIDLVCHSMGGLIGRFYLQVLGGDRRVDRLITLATPHYGSYASVYMPTRLVSQLAPDGPFLQYLNELPPPRGVETTTIAGGRDLSVVPGQHALGPFGEHVLFPDLGHLDILMSPRVFRRVRRALAAHPAATVSNASP